MHRYRISFITGLAIGYILGTRAGRERYEQLKKLARAVADNPAVQQAAGAVQAQAAGAVSTASTRVTDGVRDRVPQFAKNARSKVEDRVPGLRHKNGDGGHVSNGNGNLGDGRNLTDLSYGEGNPEN
jgi:hypothetical protein